MIAWCWQRFKWSVSRLRTRPAFAAGDHPMDARQVHLADGAKQRLEGNEANCCVGPLNGAVVGHALSLASGKITVHKYTFWGESAMLAQRGNLKAALGVGSLSLNARRLGQRQNHILWLSEKRHPARVAAAEKLATERQLENVADLFVDLT